MTDHQHANCPECLRPVGCGTCHQAWPGGVPGHLNADGYWKVGRPTEQGAPAVTPAQKALDAAQAEYDAKRAVWEDAVVAHRSAELKARSGPLMTSNGAFVDTTSQVTRKAVRLLGEAVEQAREESDKAAQRVVRARQAAALETARASSTSSPLAIGLRRWL